MLTIRSEQMAVFQQGLTRGFAERLADHLLTNYPTSSAALGGRTEVLSFVWRTISKAHTFGIQSMGAVAAIAELMIQFGEDFERSPIREWTLNILAHPTLPATAKAEGIQERHAEQTRGRVLIPY